jgi:hypothetical protein
MHSSLAILHSLRPRYPGKISRLPQPLRDQLNLLLRDGLPYAAIIAALGPAGKHLNKNNLSRWRKADHQDWLAQQHYREATAGLPEAPPGIKNSVLLLNELADEKLGKYFRRKPIRFYSFLAKLAAGSRTKPRNREVTSESATVNL